METPTKPVAGAKPAFTTQSLVMMAIFAAILCISAYISIPIPVPGAPHITLLNFVILLIALLFPASAVIFYHSCMDASRCGRTSVFIGGGAGTGYLIGPWGGYTATFILVAVILPLIRGKKYNRIRYTLSAIAGALIIDILGMFWLMAQNHLNLQSAFLIGFVPFIPLDLVKSIVAAQIVPAFKNIIKN